MNFPNSLAITSVDDLVAWLEAKHDTQPDIDEILINKLRKYFKFILDENGKIDIPKEIGLIIASQPFYK